MLSGRFVINKVNDEQCLNDDFIQEPKSLSVSSHLYDEVVGGASKAIQFNDALLDASPWKSNFDTFDADNAASDEEGDQSSSTVPSGVGVVEKFYVSGTAPTAETVDIQCSLFNFLSRDITKKHHTSLWGTILTRKSPRRNWAHSWVCLFLACRQHWASQ